MESYRLVCCREIFYLIVFITKVAAEPFFHLMFWHFKFKQRRRLQCVASGFSTYFKVDSLSLRISGLYNVCLLHLIQTCTSSVSIVLSSTNRCRIYYLASLSTSFWHEYKAKLCQAVGENWSTCNRWLTKFED